MSTFSEMISPFSVRDFFNNYWTKKHLLIKGNTNKFSELFSWSAFEDILTTQYYNLKFPDVRVVANGRVIPREEITEYSEYFVGSDVKEHISPKAINQFVKEGATIVLSTVNNLDKNLQRFAYNLKSELGEKININVYCSFPDIQSFAGHHDKHEVIIIQIAGKKVWNIFDYTTKYPVVGQPQTNPKDTPSLSETITLTPGDFLYIPRGLWHNATAKDEPSLHLTIGIPCNTGIDFISWLVTEVIDIEVFRKNLPLNFNEDGNSKYKIQDLYKYGQILSLELSKLLEDEELYARYLEYNEHVNTENSNPVDFPFCFSFMTEIKK